MYPKISDFFNELLGTSINFPIQTYGFFVAMAFLTAALIIYLELKRKENNGTIQAHTRKVWKGKPASTQEIFTSGLFGFIIGFKVVGMFFDYAYFADNPQVYILSWDGNIWGGVILAGISVYNTYRKKKKEQLEKPVLEDVEVHPYQLTGNIVLVAAIFGILGAKLFDIFEHLDDLFRDPIGTIFSFSGLAFYGGLIVAAFAVLYYAGKNKIKWPYMADIAAPALILAYAVGRMGCQLSGDGCWGVENLNPKPEWLSFLPDWMWAFKYPNNVIDDGVRISQCTGEHCYILENPVYPTPFYETSMGVIIFLILWFIRKRLIIPGYLFSIYLIFNGVERFLIEKIRVNIKHDFLGLQVTQAEIISSILILIGITGLWYFRRLYKKNQSVKSA